MATLARQDARVSFGRLVGYAGLDALVCVWLFASSFLYPDDPSFFVNNLAAGGIAAILTFFGPFTHRWFLWLPVMIGLWVTASPFALGFTGNLGATSINLLTGMAIVVLTIRSDRLSRAAHDAGVLPE